MSRVGLGLSVITGAHEKFAIMERGIQKKAVSDIESVTKHKCSSGHMGEADVSKTKFAGKYWRL